MPFRPSAAALLVLLLASAGAAPAQRDPPAQAVQRQLQINRLRYGIAGQAVLAMQDGRVLFRGTDGLADATTRSPVTPDQVFAAYSLSKLFVSTLVMQAADRGELDVDAPVGRYLPDLPLRWRGIAVRDFLDHTSGVAEYFDARRGEGARTLALPADRAAAFAALAEVPLLFAPGTQTRYTQTNYLVLTALLEARYHAPYAQIAQHRLLDPLGLHHTWLGAAAAPRQGVATAYLGRHGRLQPAQDPAWPPYAVGHADLYTTLDDLGRFLQAVTSGRLVRKTTLLRFWQPRRMADGRRGWFAGGWEYEERDGQRQAGHDGGTRVRVRVLFQDTLDADVGIIVYLTNGSARNVWSRTLIDSVMAALSPQRFPREALAEKLLGYATTIPRQPAAATFATTLKANSHLDDQALERSINATGYGIRDNLGNAPALRVFALNTRLFPRSANAWDSLAEACAAAGQAARARRLHAKARRLAGLPPAANAATEPGPSR